MSTWKTLALLLIVVGTLKVGIMQGAVEHRDLDHNDVAYYSSALINQNPVSSFPETVRVTITAYSSREEETDSTPFITASGSHVRDGIIAANWLPFGATVRIPEYFGDKEFVVEDRMHHRFGERVDIWFASTEEALRFGVREASVEIISTTTEI
jgi:3D (Asp-Asp-Asp) domain-containing protein